MVRIGHYQCVCHGGDFELNLESVRSGLALAAERQVAVVSFPETYLAGYWSSEAGCRAHAWAIDGPEIRHVLEQTRPFPSTLLVGFNELRGDDLYNTVLVAREGELLGRYSKAYPVMAYFKPGRETPVFERDGLRFGVVICADGGYLEPARIYAMKGAQAIFAPHYNYIQAKTLIDHYVVVRHDHIARAVENGVYFIRGNNVEVGDQPTLGYSGIGYGDSYILDPNGQIVAAAGLHAEAFITAEIDLERFHYAATARQRSRRSAAAFADQVTALATEQPA